MTTMTTTKTSAVEKFPTADLSTLKDELMQSGLDSWHVAELISSFLMTRGYGVSSGAARDAAIAFEVAGCSLQTMQEQLEKLAFVM
jgi:hypothetical protein